MLKAEQNLKSLLNAVNKTLLFHNRKNLKYNFSFKLLFENSRRSSVVFYAFFYVCYKS